MDDGDPLAEFLRWARPAFHADAACREHPELSWFPERGQSITAQLAVCRSCLVRAECEAAGVDGKEHGVWGATTGRQRRVMRREQHEAA